MFKNDRKLENMRRCPFKLEQHNSGGSISVTFGFFQYEECMAYTISEGVCKLLENKNK